jgi:hypothetical protein
MTPLTVIIAAVALLGLLSLVALLVLFGVRRGGRDDGKE